MKKQVVLALNLVLALVLSMGAGIADEPNRGGTLRVSFNTDARHFDMHGPVPGYEAFWVSNNVFNALVTLGPLPDLDIVPDLATSWDILDEGNTYVFHLRQGVTFHDGTAFNADVVKWNFDRMLDPVNKYWQRPFYEQVASIEVVDTNTIRFNMKEPSGALIPAMTGFGAYMVSPAAFEKYGKKWTRHPVGTGPFQLKEWVSNQRIVLERNPNYFKKGLPYLDQVEIRIMRDPLARVTALRTGAIDLINKVPVQHVGLLEKAKGIHVVTGPALGPAAILLNLRRPPFNDLRVRRAVAGYGIDRAKIAKTAYLGRAAPLVSLVAHGVPDHKDLTEMYPYDPERAKGLLAEAGYGPDKPLAFTILANTEDPTFSDIAVLLKSMMEKIGVQAKIQIMDKSTWIDLVTKKHEFELGIEDFAALTDINMRSWNLMSTSASNYNGIKDAKVDELIATWRRTVDPEARKAVSHELQTILADQIYWASLSGAPFHQAHRDRVKGYRFYEQLRLALESVWVDK